MPPPPQATADFYTTLQRLQIALVIAGRRAWSHMRDDFDASWAEIIASLLAVISGGQQAAAMTAVTYLPAVLAETGQRDAPSAPVRPSAFAGVAADGRSLEGLLEGAVVQAKLASGRGLAPDAALELGGRWLDMAVQTIVADAGRQAAGVGIAVRPKMGWVRMVNPPCCSRCALLAGRWYRYSSGFPRHPRCDCVHIPSLEDRADDFRTDPDQLLSGGHVTDLTKVQREALDDGADLGRLVNANRGMYTTTVSGQQVRATTVLANRGLVRLSPESIYQVATDQADAVRLLKRYGYIY